MIFGNSINAKSCLQFLPNPSLFHFVHTQVPVVVKQLGRPVMLSRSETCITITVDRKRETDDGCSSSKVRSYFSATATK